MEINKVKVPSELEKTLDEAYKRFKKIHPKMSESNFIETIFEQWLRPYKKTNGPVIYRKGSVILCNNIRRAIKLSGKTQTQVANEIAIKMEQVKSLLEVLIEYRDIPKGNQENIIHVAHDIVLATLEELTEELSKN